MALTVVTGRANTGKTALAYEYVKDAALAGRPAALLLPTMPDVARARRDLAGECPLGISVSTLDDHVSRLWTLFGDGRSFVSGVQRKLLCRRILLEAEGLGPAYVTPGAVGMLAAFVRHHPHPVAELQGVGEHTHTLLSLAEGYRRELSGAGLVESEEALLSLCADDPASEGATLVAHRFTTLSPSHESFLSECAKTADVMITLTWEEGAAATEAVAEQARRLASIGEHLAIETPERLAGSSELHRLERELFSSPVPEPSKGHLVLLESHGEDAEAQAVAAQVVRWLEEGYPPEEIAVAFRDPGRHARTLVRALSEAGVPCDADIRSRLGQTPLGSALRRLVAFWSQGMARTDIAAFLEGPFSGMSPDAADALAATWRGRRMTDGPSLLRDLPEDGYARGMLYEARDLCSAPLDAQGAAGWVALLDRMMAAAWGDSAPDLLADGGLDASAHRCACTALEDASLLGCPERSAQVMLALIDDTTVQPTRLERAGHVQVMSAERLRSRRFSAVAIGGLTADEFPRGRGVGDDAASSALAELGIVARGAPDLDEERFLFYAAATRARERLALSLQVSDGEGRPLRPSPFWEEVLDLYRDPVETSTADAPDSSLPPILRRRSLQELSSGVEDDYRGRAGLRARAAASQDGVGLVQVLPTHPGSGEISLDAEESFSTSELETYVQCPYRWFCQRALSPREVDETLGPRELGIVAHSALADVYERLEERTGRRRVSPETLPEALLLADVALDEAVASRPEARTIYEADGLRGARRRVRDLLRQDASCFDGFEPLHLEWGFGISDKGPPAMSVGPGAVRGRIDRIDTDGQRLLVMDYKASKATAHTAFEERGLIQLAFYAHAARHALDMPLAGALYRGMGEGANRGFFISDTLRSPGPSAGGSRVSPEELDGVIDGALERAAAAIEGILAGRIPPDPSEGACRYCPAWYRCEAAR